MEPKAMLGAAPGSPVAAEGTIAFGTYRGRTGSIDWAPLSTRRAWRAGQWKRWHYVSIAGPEVILAVAVVDVGWARNAFAYLFDRRRRRLVADRSVIGPPRHAASVSMAPGPEAKTGFRSRRLFVKLDREDDGIWRLEARSPELTVDATLKETPAGTTVCAIAAVPGGVVDCTHKTPALRVHGVAGVPGASYPLEGCHGLIDHTSGLLARDTRWRWASATDGRVALNLTEGFTAPAENVVWVDGE
ncbi:MAG: DUF2804 family protein, partial [Acidimicrobiales bacterium]